MTIKIKDMTNNELYVKYGELIKGAAYNAQYKYTWAIDKDEAEQVGWIAFLRIKDSYDPKAKNSNFEAFVSIRVRGSVIDEVRKRTTRRKMIEGKTTQIPLGDVHFEDMDTVEKERILYVKDPEITSEHFEDLINFLSNENHKKIIRWIYQYEMPISEIGLNLGICESRVSQIHKEILGNIRRYHSKEAFHIA
jgi:RNA polymerase sigma factor (sigma-70 family)